MQLFVEIVIGILPAVVFLVLVRLTGSYSREIVNLAIALSVTAFKYVDFGNFSGWIFIELWAFRFTLFSAGWV